MGAEQAKRLYESLDAIMDALPITLRDEAARTLRKLVQPEAQAVLRNWMTSHGYTNREL